MPDFVGPPHVYLVLGDLYSVNGSNVLNNSSVRRHVEGVLAYLS